MEMEKKGSLYQWMIVVMLLTLFSFITECYAPAMSTGPKEGEQLPPSETIKDEEEKTTIRKILDDPGSFEGREIVLEGIFQGWSGKCAGSPPVTRSDWVLEDRTGCIYVTGTIPTGVSLTNPKGERLILSCKIKINRDGKPFLKAFKVKKVANLKDN